MGRSFPVSEKTFRQVYKRDLAFFTNFVNKKAKKHDRFFAFLLTKLVLLFHLKLSLSYIRSSLKEVRKRPVRFLSQVN